MSTGGSGRQTLSEINVTPLVDVMLVLLIIFMVTAPLIQQGVEVNLPEARAKSIDAEMTNFSTDFLTIVKRHFFS